jgi:hypothetical protein
MAGEAPSRTEVKRMVIEEAARTGLPPSLALAVAKVESDFQPHALSRNGAQGVMQIHPQTAWHHYNVSEEELKEPRINIQLGLDQLDRLITRYNGRWDLALSHYHSHFADGRPLLEGVLPITRRYVDQVLRWQQRYSDQALVWADTKVPSNQQTIENRPMPAWQMDLDSLGDDIEDRRRRIRRYLDDFSA